MLRFVPAWSMHPAYILRLSTAGSIPVIEDVVGEQFNNRGLWNNCLKEPSFRLNDVALLKAPRR